jgi:hypothetical protein
MKKEWKSVGGKNERRRKIREGWRKKAAAFREEGKRERGMRVLG